jgi:hypothetical protein
MPRRRLPVIAAVLAVTAAAACGRAENAAQRVTRVRRCYRVEPLAAPTGGSAAGESLRVDLLVVDTGRERLERLTLLVHVVARDGRERLARRAAVDVSALVPGVPAPLSLVLPGIELGNGESAFAELEEAPPAEALGEFPEYAAARGSGR